MAHKIIDAGAQIIIGHHPHIVQGFERYNNGVIFYSIGNFFFPNIYDKSGFLHKWSKENNKSIIVKCKVDKVDNKAKVEKVEILPVFMSEDYRVVILDGKDKQKEVFMLEDISKEIKRSDYETFWKDYAKKREQELTKMELIKLFLKIRKIGVKGSIKKISMENIKCISKLLVKRLIR